MNALKQHFARRRPLLVAASLAMVVLLGIGGALAGTALAGGSSSSSGSSGTAATLNAALSSTPSATATTPATKAAKAAKAKRAGALTRLRRLGGMYGQASFHGKDNTTRTYAYERGTVTSDSGALVVKAANGTTWSWQYESATVVRKAGQKVSQSDLSTGEHVLAAGPVTSGGREARVIIIAGAKSATPAPSSSSSSSSS